MAVDAATGRTIWKTFTIDITYPRCEGPEGLRPALDRIRQFVAIVVAVGDIDGVAAVAGVGVEGTDANVRSPDAEPPQHGHVRQCTEGARDVFDQRSYICAFRATHVHGQLCRVHGFELDREDAHAARSAFQNSVTQP